MARDLLPLLVIAFVVLIARSSLADHYVVPTGSMEPTVAVGDRVLVNKLAYGVRVPLTTAWLSGPAMPARGDVVVLESPEDGEVLLKRVAAVGGDRVAVCGDRVYLGDHQAADPKSLPSPYPRRSFRRGSGCFGPITIPPGKVFLLGDNRPNSHDSRGFGTVAQQAVLGRAVAVFQRHGSLVWRGL